MTTFLFWDIDGTILNSKGAGKLALSNAATEMIASSVDLSFLVMAGMTDLKIAAQILQHLNITPEPANIEELLHLYQKHLPLALERTQGYVIPGVKEILEQLQDRADVISLLLTGNIEAGAWMKLSYYGLDSYFSDGGFCSDSPERNDIAHQALAKTQKYQQTPNGERAASLRDRFYVIGDTPHDVRCAQAIGAMTIAIASKRYSVSELIECGSWVVWESFPPPPKFIEKIGLKE